MNETLKRIKELMDERKWTFYQLSKYSEVPYNTVHYMFKRETEPGISTLKKYCKAFGIAPAEFIAGLPSTKELSFDNVARTDREKQLLLIIRSVDIHKQDRLLSYAIALSEQQ